MERIYHSWEKWEDHKHGFYNNVSGKDKKEMIQKVVDFFCDQKLTEKYMNKVINEWHYSCDHNLTNESMNHIAYIGQSAVCIYLGVPSTVTMEAWSKVPKEDQNKANVLAEKSIYKWNQQKNKNQLCLKFI